MNPLFLTIAILTLLSVTTCGAVKRYVDRHHCRSLLTGGIEAARDARNSYEEQLYLIEITKRAKPMKSDEPRPPRKPSTTSGKKSRLLTWAPISTRLNLYPLFHNVKPADSMEESPYVTITAALMRELYGCYDWFNRVPQVERTIVETIQHQCQLNEQGITPFGMRGEIKSVDQLAAVPMPNKQVQKIWFEMVMGGPNHPSLLDWVEISKKGKKINLVLAPEPLLASILPTKLDAHNVAAARDGAMAQFVADLQDDPDNADANSVIEATTAALDVTGLPEAYGDIVEFKVTNHPQTVSVAGSHGKTGITAIFRYQNP